jgi:hypothetical protein
MGQFEAARWGFLDANGNVAIEASYDGAEDFNGECAIVFHRDRSVEYYHRKYRLIGKQGQTVALWS